MTVLFWDIDGTLLTTAKGGMFAWDDAVKDITGREFQLQSMRIPGMTDYQIAARCRTCVRCSNTCARGPTSRRTC